MTASLDPALRASGRLRTLPRPEAHDGRSPAPLSASSRTLMLLDEHWHSTAVVAVGLRDAGWDVHVLTPASLRPVLDGLGARITLHHTPDVQDAAYEAAIAAYAARLTPAHIVPLSDAINQRLWGTERRGLPPVFPYATPEQQRLLRDKHAMSTLAALAGVPAPRERRFRNARELDAALDTIGLPAVVKGATGVAGDSVFIVATRDAAHTAAFSRAGLGGRLAAVQQYVEGATFLAGGLFLDGEPLRLFAAEKIEMHPPRTGPAVRVRSTADAALLAHTRRVFAALRWTGIASADFVRDADGVYRFLEVNPRPWGSVAAARACGVDLFTPFGALLAGERPAPDLAFDDDRHVALLPQLPLLRVRRDGLRAAAALLMEPAVWRQLWSLPREVAWLYLRHLWWGMREPRAAPKTTSATIARPASAPTARAFAAYSSATGSRSSATRSPSRFGTSNRSTK